MLNSAVEKLVTGEDWLQALAFAARFRARSFNNTILIWVQHAAAYEGGVVSAPEPTYVAGFQQWKDLSRSVRKGVAGYRILAPRTARMATRTPSDPTSWRRLDRGQKPQPGETVSTRMVGVRLAYVWDISGTEGPDMPTLPEPQLPAGQAPSGLWDGLAKQVAEYGFSLEMAPDKSALGGAFGLTTYDTRLVQVAANLDDVAKVCVLAHDPLTAPSGSRGAVFVLAC